MLSPLSGLARSLSPRTSRLSAMVLLGLCFGSGAASAAPERPSERVVLDGHLVPLDPLHPRWLQLGAASLGEPLLAQASPDRAADPGFPPAADRVPVPVSPDRPQDPGGWTTADVVYPVPRFRFELSARVMAVLDTQFKKGVEGAAHTIRLRRDLHVPYHAWPGYRALFEVKFHPTFAIGAQYTQVLLDGPRRHIHYRGVSLGRDTFGGHERVGTEVGLQFAEGYVRYVIRDDARIRLSVGVGAAWGSFRVRLDARRDASGRVETFFAPTINYMFSARLAQHFAIFIESTTAVIAPARFPSFASEVRAGFRFPFTSSFELVLAGCLNSAQIEDVKDLWGGQPTSTHRWNQARWSSVGLDVGVSVWF